MHWLVLRWGKSKQAIFDRVERGLAGLGHTYDAYDRGDMGQRDKLLDLIRSRSHDAILTWQRIYPNQPRLIDAVQTTGVRTVTMDFGFWPHYESAVFDGRGENFESEFRESWTSGGPRHSATDEEIDRVIGEALRDAHAGGAAEHDERIAKMTFSSVYPHYVTKIEKKGRTREELHQVINWLTGFDDKQLQKHIDAKVTFEEFFQHATLNPNAHLITGAICGYRIEEIENPLTQKARYLDKLVDELAKGKKMEKILRAG